MTFNKQKKSTYYSLKLYVASLGEKFQLKLVKTLAIKEYIDAQIYNFTKIQIIHRLFSR